MSQQTNKGQRKEKTCAVPRCLTDVVASRWEIIIRPRAHSLMGTTPLPVLCSMCI